MNGAARSGASAPATSACQPTNTDQAMAAHGRHAAYDVANVISLQEQRIVELTTALAKARDENAALRTHIEQMSVLA